VRFVGPEWAYWQLRIKGAALLLVTLGIYRFWLNRDGAANHRQMTQQWRDFQAPGILGKISGLLWGNIRTRR
jgi:hypothetical protein